MTDVKLQLKNRQIEILKNLIAAGTPMDITVLMNRFGKSERTIRYDLNEIREALEKQGIDVRTKAKKGFYIPAEQKPKASRVIAENGQQEEPSLLDDPDETRNNSMLLYLMLQSKPISADEIADTFYISRSTAIRILNNLEAAFSGIRVNSQKAYGYQLEAEEFMLRKIVTQLLVSAFKGSYTPEDWYLLLPRILKEEISMLTISDVSQAIKKVNTHYNVWLSNTAFINLLSYCLIRDLRLRKGFTQNNQKAAGSDYTMALLQELGNRGINTLEVQWMNTILNSNGIFVNQSCLDLNELDHALDEMLELLKADKHHLPYVFDTITLYDDLYEHLQHTINKEYLHLENDENPLIDELKENYADFYLLANDFADIFEKHFLMKLSENEISYLAIYLYKNLINQTASNKKVLVVCATGKGLSNLLTTRIRNVFQNLTIVGSVSPYQLDNINLWKDIDFVISTIPIAHSAYPVIKISRILSMEDIQRIQEFLHYGKFIDSIPMDHSNSASFNAKNDPFDLYKDELDPSKTDLAAASTLYSKLQLTLLEYISKLPPEVSMGQDAVLGMLIHMSMAVPRWFSQQNEEDEEEIIEAYYKYRDEQSNVFDLMEKFFALVEESLLITIPIHERYAFFLYIFNKEV